MNKLVPNVTFMKTSEAISKIYPHRKGTLYIFKELGYSPKYLTRLGDPKLIIAQVVGTSEIVHVRPGVLEELTGKE